MKLNEIRNEIDKIDEQLVDLYKKRMTLCAEVAEYKQANSMPVLDSFRESALLARVSKLSGSEFEEYSRTLYSTILNLSRAYQNKILGRNYESRKDKMKVLVINGPSINMLGVREPEIYGANTFKDLESFIKKSADELGISVSLFQSNHEGEIVDVIQASYRVYDGIVINPAAYTHTSVAILDALKAVAIPTVEVHISDISEREDFRRFSYISLVAKKTIYGKGFNGYKEALEYLKENV